MSSFLKCSDNILFTGWSLTKKMLLKFCNDCCVGAMEPFSSCKSIISTILFCYFEHIKVSVCLLRIFGPIVQQQVNLTCICYYNFKAYSCLTPHSPDTTFLPLWDAKHKFCLDHQNESSKLWLLKTRNFQRIWVDEAQIGINSPWKNCLCFIL